VTITKDENKKAQLSNISTKRHEWVCLDYFYFI